jgi:hypothetical protein
MNHRFLTRAGRLLLLALLLPLAAGAQTVTVPGGTTSGSLSWTGSGTTYRLTGNVVVSPGDTLSIGPGVTVTLENVFTSLIVDGTLLVNGTDAERVTFRPSMDGAGSVALRTGSSGQLAYADFDSLATGSSSAYDAALYLNAPASVSHCRFLRSALDDVLARADAVGGLTPDNEFSTGRIGLLAGSLGASAVWPKASASGITYRLLGDQTVSAGETLTVEPGVDVELDGIFTDLLVNGHLQAVGLAGQRVRFFREDPQGGGSVALLRGASASIDYGRFEQLGINGSTSYDCALWVDSADLALSRTIFSDNTVDIDSRADALSGAAGNNSLQRVDLRQGTIAKTSTVPNLSPTGTYYRVEGDLVVPSGVTWTVEPDVTLELDGLFTDLIVDGTILAQGAPGAYIRLQAPAGGLAGSLALRDGATAVLEGVLFDSLGVNGSSAYDAALWLDDATVTLRGSLFTDNAVDIRGRADRLRAWDGSTGIGNDNDLLRVEPFNNSIAESVTWPSFTPTGARLVLKADQTVPAGATLTITPPLDVELDGVFTDLFIRGGLSAEGTATDSIRFLGVGTTGGGSVAFLADTLSGTLRYVRFERLGINGSSAYDCALYLDGSQVAVEHAQFRNNTVDARGHGEAFNAFGRNSALDLIELETTSVDRDAVWVLADTNGVTYRLRGDLTVNAGVDLDIEAGVRVEFTNLFHDLFIAGSLQAVGTVYDSILFVGTDANGGGSVVLLDGSFNHDLAYCGFDRLGISGSSAYNAGLYCGTAGNTDVFACRFSGLTNGVVSAGGANPVIEGCAFRDNGTGIDVRNGAGAQVSYNAFSGHTGLAVDNHPANPPLDACRNHWGGGQAFNATNYPSGTGEPIGDNVIANPGCVLPVDPHVVCIPPQATQDEVLSPTSVRLAWQRVPGAFGYRVEASKDSLSGIFLSNINRRVLAVGIGAGDTILWKVKAGCPFDTSQLSAQDTVAIPLLARASREDAALRTWPQPASGTLFVERPSAEGPATWALYDLQGRLALPPVRLPAGHRVTAVDLSALPAGMWVYRLESATERSSGTIETY